MGRDGETHELLWWSLQSLEEPQRTEGYFTYLEVFPLGRHNRSAAEAIEARAAGRSTEERSAMLLRLRALRAPYLPVVESNTWEEE